MSVLRLIPGGGRKERVTPPVAGKVREELRFLANIVGALAVATFEGYECDHGLVFVSERLRVLAATPEVATDPGYGSEER